MLVSYAKGQKVDLVMHKKNSLKKNSFNWSYLVLIGCGIFYCYNALRLGIRAHDGAPDEAMRALVPQCIINGNIFPSGYDKCSIYPIGNWSYAFYPQMLGAYTSAFFMKIAQILSLNAEAIYTSGRLASILFGLIAVGATGKTMGMIFRNSPNVMWYKSASMLLLGFWPQFAFISSYMNNDIVALAGVSIMFFGLTSGLIIGWNLRNTLVLTFGAVCCELGYLNSYGFILVAAICFATSCFVQHKDNTKESKRLIALAFGICAIALLPFVTINIIRYHDPTGMSIFHQRMQQWEQENGTILQQPWTGGIGGLLYSSDYAQLLITSFVGYLGYMNIPIPFAGLIFYLAVALIGLGMCLNATSLLWKSSTFVWLAFVSITGSLITLFLQLYHTLRVDYQPQGRYIIYILIPLILAITIGYAKTFPIQSKISKAIFVAIIVFYIVIAVVFFVHSANLYSWSGVQDLASALQQ